MTDDPKPEPPPPQAPALQEVPEPPQQFPPAVKDWWDSDEWGNFTPGNCVRR